MTDPKPTDLPAKPINPDTGDQLSERSGYYDESESGNVDTPVGPGLRDSSPLPQDTLDSDGSGTTFDGGSAIPGR